jgi:hypothetical protein
LYGAGVRDARRERQLHREARTRQTPMAEPAPASAPAPLMRVRSDAELGFFIGCSGWPWTPAAT